MMIVVAPIIVRNIDGRLHVLLVDHGETTFLKTPGGKLEDEDYVDGVIREVKEELRIRPKLRLLEPQDITLWEPQTGREIRFLNFLANVSGELNPAPDIRRLGWFPVDELSPEDTAPNILPALQYFGFLN
jgi:8-oxo-dGTP pyrophosphatase MutT (NUDIX family)